MGAVHGVYLKYVGLSLASAGCASRLHVGGVHTSWYAFPFCPSSITHTPARAFFFPIRIRPCRFEGLAAPRGSLWCAAMLYGCAAVHMFVATLFIRRQGMWLIGKKPMSGQASLTQTHPFCPYVPISPFVTTPFFFATYHRDVSSDSTSRSPSGRIAYGALSTYRPPSTRGSTPRTMRAKGYRPHRRCVPDGGLAAATPTSSSASGQ